MSTTPTRRSHHRGLVRLRLITALGLIPLVPSVGLAQSSAGSPASVPAGADLPSSARPAREQTARPAHVSSRQAREADDAYLQGAKEVARKDLVAAEKSFRRAIQLNPQDRDYALALAVTREHRLTELVQSAAKARLLGDTARAEALLEQARAIDPDNAVVAQHFGVIVPPPPAPPEAHTVAASLAGAIELTPAPGRRDLHLRGSEQEILRSVYGLFGISVTFDPSVNSYKPIRLDVDNVSFAGAARIVADLTHTFAVPLQPRSVLIAEDTQMNRNRLMPQLEETVYMPGLQAEQMTEMANLARTVFNLSSVTASSSTDTIVLRGDPRTLGVLNATYDGMLGGGSDVLLDIRLYEIDRTHTNNIGLQLPSSAGAFSVAAEANQIVSANQSLVDQAIASGLIKLTGNSLTDLITEVGFLIASGAVSVAQYTNLLGLFGNGLSLAGLYVGSGATFNLLLNSSDLRILDAVQLRAGDKQDATFRAGSRYPIITSTYSAGVSSSLASAVSGLNINGTSVSSLLSQYLGSSSVTVPQVQFEDLGLTLKATPQIQHDGSVQLKLDLKIESLGAASLNSIPELNNRELTSTVTIPGGASALLASEVSSSETRDVQGLPGLGELPGFQQATADNTTDKNTGELLISITPHIVRNNYIRVASRPLLVPHVSTTGADQFYEPPPEVPAGPPPRPATTPTPETPQQPAR